MNKLSLKMKLGVGFGAVLLILAVMGFMSYTTVDKLATLSSKVEDRSHKVELAKVIELAVMKESSGVRGFLLTSDEAVFARFEQGKRDYKESVDVLSATVTSEAGKKTLAEVERAYEAFLDVSDKEVALHRAGKAKEVLDVITGPASSTSKELAKAVEEFIATQEKGRKEFADEQAATESRSRTVILSLAVVGILVGLGVAVLIVRSITGSIAGMLALIREIAANNLTIEDMEITSGDEIGQAGIALNQMKNNLHAVVQSIAETSIHVAAASEELSSTSQQITANSEETSAQANVVSTAAQTVSQNLQTVATGAEEMGASIKEIAKNATEAAKVAGSAVKVAETTTATVSKLGDSSAEIGQVIKVITSIAQQTNLLALNATIEAARAGEAGKGFAVVANEVKELAKETAKATEDISRKIEAIQTDTKAAVDAIASISGVINQINDISSTIATAVEEQNATTNEMSRNVSEAAHSSGEITSNITGVSQAAESTSRGAADTQKAAQQLVETSAELRRLVEQFKIDNGAGGSASARSMAAHA
ncbi:MAG TPA: methyl-accepting chemotaxis protein [Candidatus Dormibacteraeota bacterium]|nr:methyl-accepting chemotaxis protein [Candidatus Dormibacteraeota bacterium]